MVEFLQAGCKLITPFVCKKHGQRGLQTLSFSDEVKSVERILRTIHDEGIEDLAVHDCECIGNAVGRHQFVALLPNNLDIFATNGVQTEIENFRTMASFKILVGMQSNLEPLEGACDACGPLGAMGRAPDNTRTALSPRVTASDGLA
jgi:hypothetical protein